MNSRIGSIIKLKPEFEERYIILHKHTFPGVLDRIRKSHISNYTIFLSDGLLFSYYEYDGNNLKADLENMASDEDTQNWWKLTDPMQEPVSSRAPDEWWAVLENICHFEPDHFEDKTIRLSLRTIMDGSSLPDNSFWNNLVINLPKEKVKRFSVFQIKNLVFLYAEISSSFSEKDLISRLNEAQLNWVSSVEIFHTD